jgi:hypothetical protein
VRALVVGVAPYCDICDLAPHYMLLAVFWDSALSVDPVALIRVRRPLDALNCGICSLLVYSCVGMGCGAVVNVPSRS